MRIEKYQPQHLKLLDVVGVQQQQRGTISALIGDLARLQHPGGLAYSGFIGEEIVPIGCAGVVTVQDRMGLAWAVLRYDAGRHLLSITRAVSRFLDMQRLQRIEATCEFDWAEGNRFLTLLGFEFEGPLLCYGPNGETHARYARVNPAAVVRATSRAA